MVRVLPTPYFFASFGHDSPLAYSSAIVGHQARGILGQD
jgi:hypothetical protein